MRPSLRPRRLLAMIPVIFWIASARGLSGCGTDPVNPDGCKAIESARCHAAPACDAFGSDFDVDACERFYRDQCLKGLMSNVDPGEPRIDQCVRAIESASTCAKKSVTSCNLGTREISDPCRLIVAPEEFTECGFLDDGFGEDDAGLSPFQDAGAETGAETGPGGGSDAGTDVVHDAALDAGG